MGRAPCCEKVGLNRGPWTREEDMRLIQYIKAHGEGYWRTLPKAAGLLRCGKSCRLRWINYLRPDLKRGNISEEEDRLIIKLHSVLGNRWSLIAGRLPGRTDNEIKNYWNTYLKKKLRNMGLDPQTHLPLEKASQTTPLSISSDHTIKPFITKSSFTRKVISSPNYNGVINSSRCTRDQRAYPLFAQQHYPSVVTPPCQLIAPKPPAINFKAKPLDMDPSQLSDLKRAAATKSLQFDLHVNATCAVPSSPANIISSSLSSVLTPDHIKLDAYPPSGPNLQLNSLWDPSLISASASLGVDYSAAHVSDCSTYGSSSTALSSVELNSDLLSCMLADLYPRSEQNQTVVAEYNYNSSLSSSSTVTATTSSSSTLSSPSSFTASGAAHVAYSHHNDGTINLEDAKAIDLDHDKSISRGMTNAKAIDLDHDKSISKGMTDAMVEGGADHAKDIMPECVLSLMEGDFMWDMEMMHSFQETAGTPTGSSLLTCSFSYSLWGHDAHNDTITAPAPTWLNVGDDQ